jgi:hypothetical protein
MSIMANSATTVQFVTVMDSVADLNVQSGQAAVSDTRVQPRNGLEAVIGMVMSLSSIISGDLLSGF